MHTFTYMYRTKEKQKRISKKMRAETSDGMREKEMQAAIAAASIYPGFRFSPTDEELISYYLKKKLQGFDKSVRVISQVEINNSEPWDLPAKSVIQSDKEWFFFSSRGRKYPNGSQSKRATESGYWKATGKERNVKSGSNIIGTKRTLVFHTGRAPKGERTEWIIHEYSMAGRSKDSLVICRLRRNIDFKLNESPRKNSSNQKQKSDDSDGNLSSSEMGGEPSRLAELTRSVESSSKEHSNNYSSNSVEKLGSGNEFQQRPPNVFSQLGSSSKQDNEYEDCYADILNDDIIDLGKPLQLVPPWQGSTHRRIRMNWETQKDHQWTEPVVIESINEDCVEDFMHPQSPQSSCLVSFLSHRPLRDHSLYIVGAVLVLLVLFVSIWGAPSQVSRFLCIFYL